jgi:hypothetical protein
LCNKYDETEHGNEERSKEADTYGAPPKCKHRLAKQCLVIDECGLVGHGGYISP